jgi:ribose-phosphate pyrophosphokinase
MAAKDHSEISRGWTAGTVANRLFTYSLGIELAKTMSLNYSNQETSVTVGESVRDEDGLSPHSSKFALHY